MRDALMLTAVCRTTAEFASMSMAERINVTELTRQYWPGTIINNISAASHVDALQYLRHSQDLVLDCQVPSMHVALFITPTILLPHIPHQSAQV